MIRAPPKKERSVTNKARISMRGLQAYNCIEAMQPRVIGAQDRVVTIVTVSTKRLGKQREAGVHITHAQSSRRPQPFLNDFCTKGDLEK